MRPTFPKLAAVIAVALVLLVPLAAHARGCHEVSDIVGEEHCSRFGRHWALEGQVPILFRFGARYSEISTANLTFDEDIGKQSRPSGYQAYRFKGSALGVPSLSAIGVEGGIEVFVFHQLYLGMSGAITMGSASTASLRTDTGVQLSKDDGLDVMIVAGGIPVGYRIPLGRAALRGEVLFGAESASLSQQVQTPGSPAGGSASTSLRWLIEPRLAGDIWFTQHMSFSVYGGMNVAAGDSRDRSFGLSLTWHNRSFDGDTSF